MCKFGFRSHIILNLFCSRCSNTNVCRKEFFADAGEVVDVRFPTHEDGNRKGFCYVEFVSAEAAEKVMLFTMYFLYLVILRLSLKLKLLCNFFSA